MRVLGAGLVCIDIIHDSNSVKIMNGGSCGNVVSALSQLGFSCSVLRPHYKDDFEDLLSKTLSELEIDQILFKQVNSYTPKVIEFLNCSKHEFYSVCPECGRKVLKLTLPEERDVLTLFEGTLTTDIFYCDRMSSGIRSIIPHARKSGGVVFYEPNSSRNLEVLMLDALRADIVKFSNNRVPFSVAQKIRSLAPQCDTRLIISTDSSKGLTFSYKEKNKSMSEWVHIPSTFANSIVDTSGAGDWLTAGFIAEAFFNEINWDIFSDVSILTSLLKKAMDYSQVCSAVIGAQGVFYSPEAVEALNKLRVNRRHDILQGLNDIEEKYHNNNEYCRTCFATLQEASSK